jgi:maltooligosyltrehalose trehalohydrolase
LTFIIALISRKYLTPKSITLMITLTDVGAHVISAAPLSVRFGLYLPGITAAAGYQVVVRIIHDDDRFDPDISTVDLQLNWQGGALDLWSLTTNITPTGAGSYGQPGTYLYRYQLLKTSAGGVQTITNWFTDPFATATVIGELASFSTNTPAFNWQDAGFKIPEPDDRIVYELNVQEFNGTFAGVIDRIPYLQGIGINVLELMPVTSLKLDFDWGYGPLHYFAPNPLLGGGDGLRQLVNACHQAGIAVVLDVVYQHVDPSFPYALVYQNAGLPSPMIGAVGPFGPQIDYSQTFAQDYVAAANAYLLDEYHVDGFRYDEVDDYYSGATGTDYAKLAYDTYKKSLLTPKFLPTANTYSRIIQIAEALGKGKDVLSNTYTSHVWQDTLLNKAEDMAKYSYVDDSFAHGLDPSFSGFPSTKTVEDQNGNPVAMPVSPFQYLESHDHSQLISFFGVTQDDPTDVTFGDRSKFAKLQPFVIALYTSQGTPMLWEGQEFADNWTLPPSGRSRISFLRNMHWEYFYDEQGNPLIKLYRKLGKLRTTCPSLKSRSSYYFNNDSRPANQLIAYSRTSTTSTEVAVVFLNFSDAPQQLWIPFPKAGTYLEQIDGAKSLTPVINVGASGEYHAPTIPSNYGAIYLCP